MTESAWTVEVFLPSGQWSEWSGWVDRATAEAERAVAVAEGWVARIRRADSGACR